MTVKIDKKCIRRKRLEGGAELLINSWIGDTDFSVDQVAYQIELVRGSLISGLPVGWENYSEIRKVYDVIGSVDDFNRIRNMEVQRVK